MIATSQDLSVLSASLTSSPENQGLGPKLSYSDVPFGASVADGNDTVLFRVNSNISYESIDDKANKKPLYGLNMGIPVI